MGAYKKYNKIQATEKYTLHKFNDTCSHPYAQRMSKCTSIHTYINTINFICKFRLLNQMIPISFSFLHDLHNFSCQCHHLCHHLKFADDTCSQPYTSKCTIHTYIRKYIYIHTKLHMHIDAPSDDPYLFTLAPSH